MNILGPGFAAAETLGLVPGLQTKSLSSFATHWWTVKDAPA